MHQTHPDLWACMDRMGLNSKGKIQVSSNNFLKIYGRDLYFSKTAEIFFWLCTLLSVLIRISMQHQNPFLCSAFRPVLLLYEKSLAQWRAGELWVNERQKCSGARPRAGKRYGVLWAGPPPLIHLSMKIGRYSWFLIKPVRFDILGWPVFSK
jgi:hypothetical protein